MNLGAARSRAATLAFCQIQRRGSFTASISHRFIPFMFLFVFILLNVFIMYSMSFSMEFHSLGMNGWLHEPLSVPKPPVAILHIEPSVFDCNVQGPQCACSCGVCKQADNSLTQSPLNFCCQSLWSCEDRLTSKGKVFLSKIQSQVTKGTFLKGCLSEHPDFRANFLNEGVCGFVDLYLCFLNSYIPGR